MVWETKEFKMNGGHKIINGIGGKHLMLFVFSKGFPPRFEHSSKSDHKLSNNNWDCGSGFLEFRDTP